MKTEFITVLDHEQGKVYQYPVYSSTDGIRFIHADDIWDAVFKEKPTVFYIEDFIVAMGHNVGNCSWMHHQDETIYS